MKKSVLFCLFIFGLVAILPNVSASGDGWLDGWDDRQGITITGSSGAGTNYQVKIDVTYDAAMQTDFDDLRFTDDDGITLLDHWTESYTASTSATVWVEVADNLNTTQEIYMYYGNNTVSSASDGNTTFPNLYDDWTVESMQAAIWDQTHSDGSVSWNAAGATHGTILKVDGGAGDTRQGYTSNYTSAASFSLVFRGLIEDTTDLGTNTVRLGTSSATADPWAFVDSTTGTDTFKVRDGDGNDDNQAMLAAYFDTYIVYEITRDGTNAKLYADNVLIETASCDPDADAQPAAYILVRDTEYDLYVDWVFVRKFVTTEPIPLFGVWNDSSTADLVLNVLFHMWGYNTALIILGLVMIPTSTVYLAYGAKHDRSSDRLFYGLIIFLLGCGLFVGGIMP